MEKMERTQGSQTKSFLLISLFVLSSCLSLIFSMSNFNIASLNLDGARDIKKRMQLYELMKLKNVDIMFAQETHSNKSNEVAWRSEWDGEVILSSLTSVSAGVTILFSKKFHPLSYECKEVIEGRLMVVKAKFDCFSLTLINVYAPTVGSERVQFLNISNDTLSSCSSDTFLFVAGDFNCTQNASLDRNHLEPHAASQGAIHDLIKTHDLVDVWRRLHNNDRQYTWTHTRNNYISMARLDRIYCFKHHFSVFKTCSISPVHFSDHSLVICSASIAKVERKSAYWHFNTNLLLDDNFKDAFEFFLVRS